MKRELKHLIIIFILIIILFAGHVNALGLSVFMTPSATSVNNASEVSIKIKISNLDVGNGINKFTGTLNADSDVFEALTEGSIQGLNNWNASIVDGKITLTKATAVNSEEEIAELKLKTKMAIIKNSGTVSLKSIVVSDGQNDITTSDVSTNISITTGGGNSSALNLISSNLSTNKANNASNGIIITPSNNSTSNNVKQNNTPTNSTNNTSTYNNTSYQVNTNPGATNSDVPYTGVRENIRTALIVLLLIAGYIYIRFEKLNKIC